ncbi:MAG: hypothetical protein U0792_17855 [Gemmataceae bacterium]
MPAQNASRHTTEGTTMELTTWLPAMLILGLLSVGLMFVFVEACDKV